LGEAFFEGLCIGLLATPQRINLFLMGPGRSGQTHQRRKATDWEAIVEVLVLHGKGVPQIRESQNPPG